MSEKRLVTSLERAIVRVDTVRGKSEPKNVGKSYSWHKEYRQGKAKKKQKKEGKDIKKEEHEFESQVDKEVTTNSPKAR